MRSKGGNTAASSSLLDQETLALIDPAILHREVEIACGQHREDKNFRTIKAPFAQLLDGLLGTFRVGEKDGLCILSGGLITPGGCQRLAKNVTRNHLMMFDHDTGCPVEEIEEKITALGYFALVYTTASHMKRTSEFPESKVTEWLKEVKQTTGERGLITPQQAAEYMRQNTKIVPTIIDSVEAVERIMVAGKGVVYRITHAPMPRCRSVLVLKDPFDFAQRGTQAQAIAEWGDKYTVIANLIDGTHDKSCKDPSRLMYTPSKAPDAPKGLHYWNVIPGSMVDLDNLPELAGSGDPFENFRKQGGDAEQGTRINLKTPNLAAFLKAHADDFEAADWLLSIASDDMRKDHGTHQAFRCPNEDAHSEPKPDDLAFVVWNASQRDGKGFHMLCKHDTCETASRKKRAWYLDEACQYYGVTDAMELRAFCPRWEEEQQAQTKAENAEDALRKEIETHIENAASFDDVLRAAAKISQLRPGLVADHLTGRLVERAKPHKVTKKNIEDAIKDARTRGAGGEGAERG